MHKSVATVSRNSMLHIISAYAKAIIKELGEESSNTDIQSNHHFVNSNESCCCWQTTLTGRYCILIQIEAVDAFQVDLSYAAGTLDIPTITLFSFVHQA
ncbi:YTH domain family protein 2 [Gossypium australe]|uniref:YTH domain family protein 2 n=1 Tax=Gossypium australe TaxID=47621 RepID=A0A5B6VUB4_9ROSI|nr:YTH domain family protein 2 [Gossypium australe]